MNLILIFLGTAFVNNVILSKSLGACPFLGVSKKVETAFGMGIAVAFVMTLASATTFFVYKFILFKLNLEFLYTIAFILIIASLVQLVEMFIKKSSPTLYQSLGVFLPLITTNCAVLGIAVINKDEGYNLLEAIFSSLGAAFGFTLAIVIFASLRERISKNNVPLFFKDLPISLITAGLMAMIFLGFSGII